MHYQTVVLKFAFYSAYLAGYVSITYQFLFGTNCCYPKNKKGVGARGSGIQDPGA